MAQDRAEEREGQEPRCWRLFPPLPAEPPSFTRLLSCRLLLPALGVQPGKQTLSGPPVP